MAHLWLKRKNEWEPQKLDGPSTDLAGVFPSRTSKLDSDARGEQILFTCGGGSHAWALVVPPDSHIRVNGRAPLAGICVLNNRDEIRTGEGVQCFFSTESLATVEPFPPQERQVYCGRCRQPIEAGSPAVRCPGCGVWYNQSAELPCWTYAAKCTLCGQTTALDAGFTWVPEA